MWVGSVMRSAFAQCLPRSFVVALSRKREEEINMTSYRMLIGLAEISLPSCDDCYSTSNEQMEGIEDGGNG